MSHLSIDRLAALADEQPTSEEKSHLARCVECARELEAHRSLLAIAGTERESMGLPLTRWETLSQRLRREGLIVGSGKRDEGSASPFRFLRFPLPASRFPLQAAAAVLLLIGGAALGRRSAGASFIPGGLSGTEPTQTASGRDTNLDLPVTFASVEEASKWKDIYSDAYQKTLSFLANSDSAGRQPQTPAVMRARLSALNRMTRTAEEALSDAPLDPVINDFYFNSFSQREATLRQLNTVLPQGVRLKGF